MFLLLPLCLPQCFSDPLVEPTARLHLGRTLNRLKTKTAKEVSCFCRCSELSWLRSGPSQLQEMKQKGGSSSGGGLHIHAEGAAWFSALFRCARGQQEQSSHLESLCLGAGGLAASSWGQVTWMLVACVLHGWVRWRCLDGQNTCYCNKAV